MYRRKIEIKCIDPTNPDPSKRCLISSRPSHGSYNCIYCGRVMEKQFEDDAKDIESFGGKNERRNVTNISTGQDTSSMLLRGNDKTTQTIRAKFTEYFNAIEAGNDAIENAMQYYEKYQKLKLKAKDNSGDKIKKVKKENLMKGIVLLVIDDRNISRDKNKFKKKLGWELSDMTKQKDNIRKILGIVKPKFKNDYDNEIREKCNALGIGELATQCIDIFDEISRILDGRQPTTIVSCVIYFVCQIYHITKINETDISQLCGSSADTIKKTYKQLVETNRIERIKALIKK